MGLGIIEPKGVDYVPGTAILYQTKGSAEPESPRIEDSSDSDSLRLIPVPSASPRDPLNWPKWKKDLTFFSICYMVIMGTLVGPTLSSVNGVLVEELHVTFNQVSLLTGCEFIASACTALIYQTVAKVWGKRPVYIFATLSMFVGVVWNACLKMSYVQFMTARTFQGLGLGAFETLPPSSIGDLFFVHQRGKRVAFFNMTFFGLSYLSPIIGGYIAQKYGWQMQFKIIAAFCAVGVVLILFFCPETAYNRPAVADDSQSQDLTARDQNEKQVLTTSDSPAADSAFKTWLRELSPYNGRFSDERIVKIFLRPFAAMIYPAILWAFMLQGTVHCWSIGVSIMMAQLFAGPPLNFGPAQLGYIYAFPAVASLFAYLLGLFLSDWVLKVAARRNNGVAEPEFRLFFTVGVLVFGAPGLFAFGRYAALGTGPDASGANVSWVLISFFYGMIVFGLVCACTATFSYLLDAHRAFSAEFMIALVVLRNMFAFGGTYFMPTWLETGGPEQMFYSMGGILFAGCLLTIPIRTFFRI
ncbi:hypothetical protein T310_1598 [Rasamsonia emersonii CBS 393.64]|uniref:Major facilitator superfamily (MFS) profile domain-containing protein n=1 Tax=Rasamsonia emersonii (strain ATCC 16479 / CBS 393.64 / IMI 116815) TaxID=1408163 RepID=A0A0F4Z3F6_RASE3|nr:hypothetical protein T310_1598 [Rasamsonia emersonii CBS 393.64]KKA24413.1 hypothetical protein T310_1598 [Rasamsonia emersonii CBS 393.64]